VGKCIFFSAATAKAGYRYSGTPEQDKEEWTKVSTRRTDKGREELTEQLIDELASTRQEEVEDRKEKRLILIYLHDRNSPACLTFSTQVPVLLLFLLWLLILPFYALFHKKIR
jgi:hypothetical protein